MRNIAMKSLPFFQFLTCKDSPSPFDWARRPLSGAGWLKENHPRFAPVFSFAEPCTIKAKDCPASKKSKFWLHGAGHVQLKNQQDDDNDDSQRGA